MMRSMYAGVSGLRNHQQRMDVIGNNIANVNTYGYKKARVVFKDALNQTIRGGSAPTTDRGGTNPQSIGLGVALSSIDTICTAGSTQTTGNNTDLAIDGNGYFVVSGGGETAYTRAGNFSFDSAGNYVNSGNGMKVMGWMADISNDWTIDTTMALQAIDISGYKTVNPVSTTSMELEGNCDSSLSVLSATDHTTKLTSKDVYDSLGNTTTLYFQFEKMWSGNQIVPADASTTWSTSGTAGNRPGTIWRIRASSEPNCPAPTGTAATTTTDYFMAFDENGNLYDSAVWPGTTTAEPDDLTITWDSNVMALFNDTANAELTSQNITVNFPGTTAGATTPQTIALDFANLKQHNATHDAQVSSQDGYAKGDLSSVSVDQSGVILGAFSNGVTKNLGRVGLATFQNPAGLEAKGGSLYGVSNNSGDATIVAAGEGDAGVIKPGTLEMSNVDLSEEFTDMIVTQRGFQANSRIITTSDEMLQELVNLKR